MIWSLIVGALIGAIGGYFTNKGKSMGWFANIIAGLIGSSIGQTLFGTWGPKLANMALIPSVLGSIILILLVSYIFKKK